MRVIPPSELVINGDGSVFHLHLRPEQLADRVILVGDPERVERVAARFECRECEARNREYHTITGLYQGKRITVLSHGVGCGNIDIVMSELDALANVDFRTRKVKPSSRSLTLVRIGTSGGLCPDISLGSYVVASKSIGFDGVLYFYEGNERVRDREMEDAFLERVNWRVEGVRPYVVSADPELVERIATDRFIRGVTLTANGFYGPQGRHVRLSLADEDLNQRLAQFEHEGYRVANYEMESAPLAGLAALMGHRAMTVCCVIAGRASGEMNTDYKPSMEALIDTVLDRL